jgi:hypothetical protein
VGARGHGAEPEGGERERRERERVHPEQAAQDAVPAAPGAGGQRAPVGDQRRPSGAARRPGVRHLVRDEARDRHVG